MGRGVDAAWHRALDTAKLDRGRGLLRPPRCQAVEGEAAEAGHTIDTAAAGTASAGLLWPSLANAATRVVAPPAKAGLVRLGWERRGRGGIRAELQGVTPGGGGGRAGPVGKRRAGMGLAPP